MEHFDQVRYSRSGGHGSIVVCKCLFNDVIPFATRPGDGAFPKLRVVVGRAGLLIVDMKRRQMGWDEKPCVRPLFHVVRQRNTLKPVIRSYRAVRALRRRSVTVRFVPVPSMLLQFGVGGRSKEETFKQPSNVKLSDTGCPKKLAEVRDVKILESAAACQATAKL